MELTCTKKLLEYMGAKPEKASEQTDPLFQWAANLMVINRRKTHVAVLPILPTWDEPQDVPGVQVQNSTDVTLDNPQTNNVSQVGTHSKIAALFISA